MNKRGQITLFVIVGILIIAAIGLLYYFKPQILGVKLSPEEAQKLVTSQVSPVRDIVESCMEDSTRKMLDTMGRQGGHLIPDQTHVSIPRPLPDAPLMNYALFYDNSLGYINELPSLEEMKKEVVPFLEGNFDFAICISDFKSFNKILNVKTDRNLTIDINKVDFGEKSGQIVIPYTYNVQISKGNASTNLKDFEMVIPIDLAKIRGLTSRILNKIVSGDNYRQVITEESDIEWSKLRKNPNADKIFSQAEAYTDPPSEDSGKVYNEKNLIFTLEYQNKELIKPYKFNFLVGEK